MSNKEKFLKASNSLKEKALARNDFETYAGLAELETLMYEVDLESYKEGSNKTKEILRKVMKI
jgi:hypothetical protein